MSKLPLELKNGKLVADHCPICNAEIQATREQSLRGTTLFWDGSGFALHMQGRILEGYDEIRVYCENDHTQAEMSRHHELVLLYHAPYTPGKPIYLPSPDAGFAPGKGPWDGSVNMLTHELLTVYVDSDRVRDLICAGLEAPRAWGQQIERLDRPTQGSGSTPTEVSDYTPANWHVWNPTKGGSITIHDAEDGEAWTLDGNAIAQGLFLLAESHPKDFRDWVEENEDAVTGDIFLQLAVLGEVVYG